ncbi:MAG: hypothetical protein LUG48_17285 [Klebsiella quasipneumoniae]|nr:hypothetical protein [Klebsiella quasipneumoniae]
MKERVALWTKMTPRHQDYHWRLMTPEERRQFKSQLSRHDQEQMRNRFIARDRMGGPGGRHHPEIDSIPSTAKRLSDDERGILRQQIQQARQALASKKIKEKTPAQVEHETLLKIRRAQLHDLVHTQILVISLQPEPVVKADPAAAPDKGTRTASNNQPAVAGKKQPAELKQNITNDSAGQAQDPQVR